MFDSGHTTISTSSPWKPVPRDKPATLDYFMSDYVAHLKHHLAQIGIGLD